MLVADFREDDRIVYIIFTKKGGNVPIMEKEASGDEKTMIFSFHHGLHTTTSSIAPRNEAEKSLTALTIETFKKQNRGSAREGLRLIKWRSLVHRRKKFSKERCFCCCQS